MLMFERRAEAAQNMLVLRRAAETCEASLKNNAVSSACWLMLISLSATGTPLGGLSRMRWHSSWAQIRNRSGEVGQARLTPPSRFSLGEEPVCLPAAPLNNLLVHPFNISTEVFPKVTFFHGFKYKLIFNRVQRFVEIYKQDEAVILFIDKSSSRIILLWTRFCVMKPVWVSSII